LSGKDNSCLFNRFEYNILFLPREKLGIIIAVKLLVFIFTLRSILLDLINQLPQHAVEIYVQTYRLYSGNGFVNKELGDDEPPTRG